MTIILDLDYTLLDTERFKEALADVFADCGVSGERFLQTYKETAEHNSLAYDYALGRHIELLEDELSCPVNQLRQMTEAVLANLSDYLYPDAAEFITKLRKAEFYVILLTLGNESWQQAKVEHSGLADCFDEMQFVSTDKASALERFADAQLPVFVINDNCDEVKAMKEIEPSYSYIVKRGPKGVPDDIGVPVLDTFEEIFAEIKRQID